MATSATPQFDARRESTREEKMLNSSRDKHEEGTRVVVGRGGGGPAM